MTKKILPAIICALILGGCAASTDQPSQNGNVTAPQNQPGQSTQSTLANSNFATPATPTFSQGGGTSEDASLINPPGSSPTLTIPVNNTPAIPANNTPIILPDPTDKAAVEKFIKERGFLTTQQTTSSQPSPIQ